MSANLWVVRRFEVRMDRSSLWDPLWGRVPQRSLRKLVVRRAWAKSLNGRRLAAWARLPSFRRLSLRRLGLGRGVEQRKQKRSAAPLGKSGSASPCTMGHPAPAPAPATPRPSPRPHIHQGDGHRGRIHQACKKASLSSAARLAADLCHAPTEHGFALARLPHLGRAETRAD